MSMAIAGLRVSGVQVDDAECVKKTWPDFFNALDRLAPPLVIAIDGPGGVGKSTVSAEVARRFGFAHLDTGAFYRAATLLALQAGVDPADAASITALTEATSFAWQDGRMLMSGEDVSAPIRSDEVNAAVSAVSAHSSLRALLVQRQRSWVTRHDGRAVVEGRDIGTVVFPDSPAKFFLTARPAVRAARRAHQGDQSIDAVSGLLSERDRKDTARAASPLRRAEDAVEIDTSDLTAEEVVEEIAGAVSALGT